MFEAYSIKKRDKISIDDVVDLSDTFKCLNPECKAEFSVKGLNSGIVQELNSVLLIINVVFLVCLYLIQFHML